MFCLQSRPGDQNDPRQKTVESCEAQARIGRGWPSRRKGSKLKALPRAYIKVGCHPPTTTQKCRVTIGHLRVTVSHPRVAIGHLRVTIGHLKVPMGHLRLPIGYLKATVVVVHIRVTLGYFFL